jgi:hypothetical protein
MIGKRPLKRAKKEVKLLVASIPKRPINPPVVAKAADAAEILPMTVKRRLKQAKKVGSIVVEDGSPNEM